MECRGYVHNSLDAKGFVIPGKLVVPIGTRSSRDEMCCHCELLLTFQAYLEPTSPCALAALSKGSRTRGSLRGPQAQEDRVGGGGLLQPAQSSRLMPKV